MKFKFFPHTADIIFEAYGQTIEKVFENSGLALEEIMVEVDTVKNKESFDFTLEAETTENLLYDFLSELIFVKDTEGLLFNKFEVTIIHKNKKYELLAKCEGENIDKERHKLGNDAKAITMHEFEIKQDEKGKWISRVLVDI